MWQPRYSQQYNSLTAFFEGFVAGLDADGKLWEHRKYQTTLNKLRAALGHTLSWAEVDADALRRFERHLRRVAKVDERVRGTLLPLVLGGLPEGCGEGDERDLRLPGRHASWPGHRPLTDAHRWRVAVDVERPFGERIRDREEQPPDARVVPLGLGVPPRIAFAPRVPISKAVVG